MAKTQRARSTPKTHAGGRPARAAIRGALLQARREAAKLSRERCAALICGHGAYAQAQSIYQWERGVCRPDAAALAAWCAVLGIEPAAVLAEAQP